MTNCTRKLLTFIVLFGILEFTYAQDIFTKYDELPNINKSYKPAYNEDYPDWAKMLYQYPINFNEIREKFEAYTKENGKEKTPIVRYYKLWTRSVLPYILNDGTIKLPNIEMLQRDLRKTQEDTFLKTKSANTSSNWTFLGPKETFWLNESNSPETPKSCPWQVNVYSIDVAASNNNILYCGTETGFVNKSEDKGLTWSLCAPNYVFGGGVTAVAIHPSKPNVVYVSGGKQIHKTIDGGVSWSPMLPSYYNFNADRFKIDPNNPEKIIAATSNGIFISSDGGSSWTKRWSEQTYDIEIKPDDSNTIYAITKKSSNKFSIVVSTDGGTSFSAQQNFPSNITQQSGGLLAVTSANASIVYATMLAKENDDSVPYLYKGTNNNGSWSWEQAKKGEYHSDTGLGGFTTGQGYFDLVLEASPTNENLVFWGTCSLWKSTNGAKNFIRVGGYGGEFAIHPDIQDLKMLPNGETWVATDGGITFTTDNFTSTSNYFSRTNGVVGSDMWGFDQGWNEDIIIGGRYHNGNTAIADFYGEKALRMGGAESPTGWVLQGKSRHVAFNDLGNGWILPKTATGAPEGRFIFSKYPNMDEYGGRRSNLLHHPNYYGILYLGEGNGFWKSEDMGVSFDLLHSFPGRVRYMQISFKNPDVIYADIVDNGLYKSVDGGNSWTLKPTLTNGAYGSSYWKGKLFFAISPYDENVLYACLQNGTWSSDIGKVFKSQDGGDTWEDWSVTYSGYSKCMTIQPTAEGKDLVYLFTSSVKGESSRVFYRKEDMGNWADFGTNYPAGMNVNIALPFFRDSKLRVGGNGSVWESPLVETEFAPILNFWVEKPVYNCMLDTLCFDDHSMLNHEGATWNWEITPDPEYISNANSRNPKVVLGQPGSYNVKVALTKDGNTYSKTIENMVTATTCPTLDDCGNPASIPQNQWTLVYVDSEETSGEDGKAINAFDGDPSTIWHTQWAYSNPTHPHEIQIDLGKKYNIHELTYLPRQTGYNGRIKNYELYISESKTAWGSALKTGTFIDNTAPQKVKFESSVVGRYVRLKALSEVNGNSWTSVAEISLVGCFEDGQTTDSNLFGSNKELKAFPVPTSGFVYLTLPSPEEFTYKVFSCAGQIVMEGKLENNHSKIGLNLNSNKSGIYIIELLGNNGVTYRVKVVKK